MGFKNTNSREKDKRRQANIFQKNPLESPSLKPRQAHPLVCEDTTHSRRIFHSELLI